MSLPDAVQGATRPSAALTWLREGTTTPEPLTGATLTGTIRSMTTGVVRAITGTVNVTDGAAGEFLWSYSAADVAEEGLFTVQFNAAFASSPTPARTFAALWTVRDRQ